MNKPIRFLALMLVLLSGCAKHIVREGTGQLGLRTVTKGSKLIVTCTDELDTCWDKEGHMYLLVNKPVVSDTLTSQ